MAKQASQGKLSRRQLMLRSAQASAGLAAFSMPASVTAAPTRQARKKIIFVSHDLNPFFVPIIVGSKEMADFVGWDHQFVGPPVNDVQKTVEMQLNAIQQSPTAVGFTVIDPKAFVEPIKQAFNAGIKVVIYNTLDPTARAEIERAIGMPLGYVGQEFLSAGRINGLQAAKYAQELSGKKEGKIIMGTIAPGHFALETRMKGTAMGVDEYNKANGTNYTTEVLQTSTNEAEAISRIQAKYAAEGDTIVGWAFADYVHWFCGNWMKQNNLVGKMSNGGFDLLDGVLANIKDGSAQWTIGQNPYAQGWVTTALAWMWAERLYPPSDYNTGAELIDKSNIDDIIKREEPWKQKGRELGIGG